MIASLISEEKEPSPVYALPDRLWLLIMANWDVFTNIGTLEPWWKLGNLKKDSMQTIFDNFESDRIPALRANYSVTIRKLAQRYGDPNSQLVFNGPEGY